MRITYTKNGMYKLNRPNQDSRFSLRTSGSGGSWTRRQGFKLYAFKPHKKGHGARQ